MARCWSRATGWGFLGTLALASGCNSILGNTLPGSDGSGGQDLGGGGGLPAGSGGVGDAGAGGASADTGGATTGSGGMGGNPTTEVRTTACGLNDRGEQDQTLQAGQWVDVGACDDPDECVDDLVDETAPCAAGGGLGTRVCVGGTWDTTECICAEAAEEYDALADACLVPTDCDPSGEPFGGGDGVSTPHLICSAAHLQNIEAALSALFLLAESLDLSAIDDFVPIGSTDEPFTGEFDGGGRALVGLVIDRSSDALGAGEVGVGLFGKLEGQVLDLVLRDFEVRGESTVGTLAGSSYEGVVERVHVVGGTVTGSTDYVGGLIGSQAFGKLIQSSSSSSVSGGGSSVGGLAGLVEQRDTLFDENSATGTVVGTSSSVGGLVGTVTDTFITHSSARGRVTGGTGVGGLIGFLAFRSFYDTEVTECSASGDVTGTSEVGGLIGRVFDVGTISGCTAAGDVEGTNSVGGLIGDQRSARLIQNYSVGSVTSSGVSVGGLSGAAESGKLFQENYAYGLVTWTGAGSLPGSVGALVGFLDDLTIERSFARSHTPVLALVGEIGSENGIVDGNSDNLALASFGSQANFPGWDFADVWVLSSELGRPVLRWQLEE